MGRFGVEVGAWWGRGEGWGLGGLGVWEGSGGDGVGWGLEVEGSGFWW